MKPKLNIKTKTNYMIIECPDCKSENVTRLSVDPDEFICDDCGRVFEDNNELEKED